MTNSQQLFGEEAAKPQEEAKAVEAPVETEGQDQQPEVKQEQESVFSTVVGEGKRYSDADSLAKAKLEADSHIKRIEEENAKLREENSKLDSSYAAILDRLEKKQSVSNNDLMDAQEPSNQPQEVDLDSIVESKISETLTKREREKLETENIKVAKQLAIDTYGDIEIVNNVVNDFLEQKPYMKGVVNDLLRTDPEAFIKEIITYKSPESVGSMSNDPVSSVNDVHVDGKKYITWSDASKVMRTDLKRYKSAEFKKLMDDSVAYFNSQGKDFYKT